VAVFPELLYDDPGAAAGWLCAAFGFTERLRAGNDHVQLSIDCGCGPGAVFLSRNRGDQPARPAGHYVHVAVADVAAHYARALAAGANVQGAPAEYPYGERQYAALDPQGHRWNFSQSVADTDPADWGATVR
jgi:uncharacterized glyoxalase superfamily protein PhnB